MNEKLAKQSSRHQLISKIYEVTLKPGLYGNLIDLWEQQISDAVGKLRSIEEDNLSHGILDDSELLEHFQRAYEILERMGRQSKTILSPDQIVASKTKPTCIFDHEGRLVAQNDAAEKCFGKLPNQSDLSHFVNSEDAKLLERYKLRIMRPAPLSDVLVLTMSVNRNQENHSSDVLFIVRTLRTEPDGAIYLCVSELVVEWPASLEQLIKDSFSLTPSEIAILKGLCDGQNLGEIAQTRNRSLHTVRSQIKSLLPKMRCNSQSDLVRVVLTLSDSVSGQSSLSSLAKFELTGGNQEWIKLGDDRQMPVNVFGPSDGLPVLFIHGMLDGFVFGQKVSNLIERYNIRLIAPTRPGFGEHNFEYPILTAPQKFAEDLQIVLDHFEITKCTIVGHMAGAVYAFEAARNLKGRISNICNVAGGVPIVSLRQFSAMSPRQRVVAWTARFTPRLLPTILRAGISQLDAGDLDDFMGALYAENSVDRSLVSDPNIAEAVKKGYRFAVEQGHRAFEVDAVHVTRDWSEYLADITQPVTLFHGFYDPVVSIDSVREFAARYDNISLIEMEDTGQLALFHKPELIFAHLADNN